MPLHRRACVGGLVLEALQKLSHDDARNQKFRTFVYNSLIVAKHPEINGRVVHSRCWRTNPISERANYSTHPAACTFASAPAPSRRRKLVAAIFPTAVGTRCRKYNKFN